MNSTTTETTGHIIIAHMRWYTLQHKSVDDVQDNGDNGGQVPTVRCAITLFIT